MILLKKNNYNLFKLKKNFRIEKIKYKFLGLDFNKKYFISNLKDKKFKIFERLKKKNFFFNLSKILDLTKLDKLKIFDIYFFIKKVKNNLFLNFSSNDKIIYKNSLKSMEKLKNKNELYNNFNLLYLFIFKSINNFLKKIICVNFYLSLKKNFSFYFFFEAFFNFIEKKFQRKMKNFLNFFLKIYINNHFKHIKFLFFLKKIIKKIKNKTKIRILFTQIIYKKAYNGCKLKKNRRL